MSNRLWFSLCAFPALSTVHLAPGGDTPVVPAAPSAAEPSGVRGFPALFSWVDVDGDGRLDLTAVSAEGTLRVLADSGEGRFEDVTERVGLFGLGNAALAAWADYDGDGRADLFLGARGGPSRLFHNDYGVFIDVSARSGLACEGTVQSAQWLDHDSDGRLDLFVVSVGRSVLFRGVEGGFFQAAELALPGGQGVPGPSLLLVEADHSATQPPREGSGGRDVVRHGGSVGPVATGKAGTDSGSTQHPSVLGSCADSISDQANPGQCITASTTPTLRKLYPLSRNLFVSTSGNVGIGTTSPAAKLDVSGAARISGTLTLGAGADPALDLGTGSIRKDGAVFLHTNGNIGNTALGREALAGVTTGTSNTACGDRTLFSNTTGTSNTAIGREALTSNTGGFFNTATGLSALRLNTTGYKNTAIGAGALLSNTYGGLNTASGFQALYSNTSGSFNAATGYRALSSNTSGFGNTGTGSVALRINTTGGLNTASGFAALYSNTTGYGNTANGSSALGSNTIGGGNTAIGSSALSLNSTGSSNTAIGTRALYANSTGNENVAIGIGAGADLTTGDDNIVIGNSGVAGEAATTRIGTSGTQTRAFLAGVHGVTTDVADGIPVVVDSAGQLGTVSSSRRFKKDVADMGDATGRLLELRPVVFRYDQEQTVRSGEVPLEYGLVAEEVAEIFPDLVVRGEDGRPFTVRYHILSSMLLNELKKLHERFEAESEAHQSQLSELRSRLAAIETRISATDVPAVEIREASPPARSGSR